jgi:hypothetical protein
MLSSIACCVLGAPATRGVGPGAAVAAHAVAAATIPAPPARPADASTAELRNSRRSKGEDMGRRAKDGTKQTEAGMTETLQTEATQTGTSTQAFTLVLAQLLPLETPSRGTQARNRRSRPTCQVACRARPFCLRPFCFRQFCLIPSYRQFPSARSSLSPNSQSCSRSSAGPSGPSGCGDRVPVVRLQCCAHASG